MAKKIKKFDRIIIDDERINHIRECYFKWKDLNTSLKSISTRGINIPDVISEPMACWCLDYLWNRGGAVGDAYDPKTNRRIEFKASSNFDTDLSSFGPKTVFDNLVFLRFDTSDNKLYIYDLNIDSEHFGQLSANKKQTIAEQKEQKRRPRVPLIKLFDLKNKEPTMIFNIMLGKVEVDNRIN